MSEPIVPVVVRLTVAEMSVAGLVGAARNAIRLGQGARHRYAGTDPAKAVANNVHGVMAEIALAKALGRYWPPSVTLESCGDADVPPDAEARWTGSREPRLRIYRQDKASRRYFLITGTGPQMTIHGFVLGSEAPTLGDREDSYGTQQYVVPAERLHPAIFPGAA